MLHELNNSLEIIRRIDDRTPKRYLKTAIHDLVDSVVSVAAIVAAELTEPEPEEKTNDQES